MFLFVFVPHFMKILLHFVFFSILLIACNESIFLTNSKRWINAEKTNLRIAPLALASVLEILTKNTPVEIIGRTKNKVKIGKNIDYWYRIKLENKIEGWIYGTSLSKQAVNIKNKEQNDSKSK